MTDDDRQRGDDPDTIVLEGAEVDVATHPERSHAVAVRMTVSAEETVSTGQYESYSAYQSTTLRLEPAVDMGHPEARAVLQDIARRAHHAVQDDVDFAVDQRLSDPDFTDWPDDTDPTADDGEGAT